MPLKALSSDKKGASSCPPPIPTGMGDGAEALGPKGEATGSLPLGARAFSRPTSEGAKTQPLLPARGGGEKKQPHVSPRPSGFKLKDLLKACYFLASPIC